MTKGFVLNLTLQLGLLFGGIQAPFSDATYAATLRHFDGRTLAIVIQHVGEQDRAVPRLVLYSGNKAVIVQQFDCARGTSCFSISPDVSNRLFHLLDARLSSQHHDDVDIEQAGSFQFSIEGQRVQKTHRMNKLHSSDVFRELIELVTDSAIRRELKWRLSIARI